jgi:hypothetical protein
MVWRSDNGEQPVEAVTGPVSLPAWSLLTLRVDRPATTVAR